MSSITNGKVTGKKRLNRVGGPHFLAVNPPKSFVGSLPPFTVAEKRAARQRQQICRYPSRKATSFSRSTDASPGKFATNAESYSVRFASPGTANRKCTALANVGVMLKGLRPTGGDGRSHTRLSANAEPQRHDSSRFIGRILMRKKLSVFNQKQRACRRKKCLSRTWVHLDLENPSVRA